MRPIRKKPDPEGQARLLAQIRRDQEARQSSYRGLALKLLPHVCGHCGREFEDKRLRELTVHHKDHNHNNNPPDGSNWELLCIYCHEYEHVDHEAAGQGGEKAEDRLPSSTFQPFQGLDALLKKKDDTDSHPKDT